MFSATRFCPLSTFWHIEIKDNVRLALFLQANIIKIVLIQ